MTSMDKAGIGIAIGITIIAVAIAGAGTNLQSEGPSGSPFVAPPTTQSTMEKEESSQKSMEQIMKEQREQFTEGTGDATVSAPRVEDVGPQTVTISMPSGTSVPGCEETNACYIPAAVNVNAGDTVVWSNDDTAAHTVTGGTPTGGPDGSFDSGLVMAGASFEIVADTSGSYDYFCMVHPWMIGNVRVN